MEDIFRRFFYHIPAGFVGGDDGLAGPQRRRPTDGLLNDDDADYGFGGGDFHDHDNFAGKFGHDVIDHFDRHFEHIFKSFGFESHPEDSFLALPPIDSPVHRRPKEDSLSLRDRLLKRDHRDEDRVRLSDVFPKEDTDLDAAVSEQGLSVIDVEPRSSSRSFFTTTKITIQGTDGKLEERLTKRDSVGNEETVVRRQLGDRSHRVVTRRDTSGVQEHQEDLVNMDENSLGEFNQRWNSPQLENSPDEKVRERALAPAIFGGDQTAPALFRKLFGSLMPQPPTKP